MKSVDAGRNRIFTARLLVARPSAAILPKAASASAVRPSFMLAMYRPLKVRSCWPSSRVAAVAISLSASSQRSAL
jgi:hypothetical protein